MDYERLLEKQAKLIEIQKNNSGYLFDNFDKAFEVDYAHNSTAIEGNTLTLIETKVLLEDHISVGNKSLREIYEIVNHNKAFAYVKKCIADKKPLDENIVKDIHSILMENILVGGVYRNVEVRITVAKHKPPAPGEMYYQIKEYAVNGSLSPFIDFIAELEEQQLDEYLSIF